MKGGQLFSLEGVMSIVLFVFVLLFLVSFWNLFSSRIIATAEQDELHLQAAQIAEVLVSTSGFPPAWEKNPSQVSTPGLMRNPGELNENKLNQFLTLDYNQTKQFFNIERFDFFFEIRDEKGNVLNSSGLSPTSTSSSVAFQRLVLVNNQISAQVITVLSSQIQVRESVDQI